MAWDLVTNIKGIKGDAGSWSNGNIPTGTDLNSFRSEGVWSIPNSTVGATLLNMPAAATTSGVIRVESAKNTTGIFIQYADLYSSGGLWRRTTGSVSAQTWTTWKQVDINTTITVNSLEAAQRPVLVDAFKRRRGRLLGTGGKAVITFRIDHGLTKFKTAVAPMLAEHNFPAMVTMNSRTWTDATNSGATQAEARSWWLNNGIEFSNHAATHNDAPTQPAIEDEIVNGLTELQGQFPESPIEMYCPPGVSGSQFLGFDGGDTLAKWYTTVAGKTILQHHAAASGYLPGIYRPLPADMDIGLVHYTIDAELPADVEAAVRGVIASGGSMTLMIHPVYLDTVGYMTTAGLSQVMAYVAGRRDAGEVEVLTASGALIADPRSSDRHDLILNGGFDNGLTDWTGTGWTVATVNGFTWASTTTGTALTQTVSLSRIGQYRGSNRELIYRVRTGAAAVTVETTVTNGSLLNATKQHTIPANTTAEVRQPLSIPLADGTTLTVRAGRVSGGAVDITDIRLQAI